MWELYAFWGWVGTFLVASTAQAGMSLDQAASWGGAMASVIILLGAVSVWVWGRMADKMGRTRAILIASLCSALSLFGLGCLLGHSWP